MAEKFQLSRRALLGLGATGLAGIGLGVAGTEIVSSIASRGPSSPAGLRYDFYGEHQQGIITPAQDRMHFASFSLAHDASRIDLIELLQDWTIAAEAMTQGRQIGAETATASYDAPPADTGENIGLSTAGLTITFGLGTSLFMDSRGQDRFGLGARRPDAFRELPHFPGDDLDSTLSEGDLCIQACANDPMVAVHAIRNLTRIAFGRAVLKWSQLGYGRTSSTTMTQQTERNLFGFKDGTNNVKAENTDEVDKYVWVSAEDQPWLTGGTYMVTRRIRMNLEQWDRTSLREQETVFGRNKTEGAPLSGGSEFTPPKFGSDGNDSIDPNAHITLAHPNKNGGVKLLRRGYNFVDGNDDLGRLNAGLFFVSFQHTPQSFVTVQQRLASSDRLNEYIKHVGSGLWVIPRGITPGSFIGSELLLA